MELRKGQELKQEVKGYKLGITSDFGNSATINIFYKKGNDELKIQIENRGKEWQYRWCVGIDEKKIVGNASEKKNILNKFFEKYVQVEWFVDYKANSKRNTANYIKKIKDHISEEMLNTSQTIPYNVYDCRKEAHEILICQYWNIKEGELYSNIINRIKTDMKHAWKILENSEK